MRKQEIVKLMERIHFFKEFEFLEKKELAQSESHVLVFNKGDFIIRQGELSSAMFVLIKGKVAVTKNEVPQSELNKLEPGDLFGEVPVLTGMPRLTNVVAKTKAVVFKLDDAILKQLNPMTVNKFKDQILKILISRLEEMNSSMSGLKSEFERFYEAYETISQGIDNIISTSEDIRIIQKLSYVYFNAIRKR